MSPHPLLGKLASADADERCEACRAIGSDPAAVLLVEGLLEALGDPVRAVAREASNALAQLAKEHELVPDLRAALHAGSASRRAWAALTLARLEPPGIHLVPALVESLALPDAKLRWWASRLLVDAGRLDGQVLSVLIGLSRSDQRAVVRRMARHCLRELSRDDPSAAHALLEGLADPDVPARRAAYAALASLLEPPRAVFDTLGRALTDEPDPACRRIATVALGALAANAPDGLPANARAALERARDDSTDPALRRGATRALT